jgi:hypothetical protein
MKTLAAAWNWYRSTKESLQQLQRIGRKYWTEIPWETAGIGRDEHFRTLEASEIEEATTTSLGPIDDLAVVVLFSVFESHVRDHVVRRMSPEMDTLKDPILMEAAEDARRGVEEGSFFRRVLEPLKNQRSSLADLVTRVDQVRDYRNWVAHGRRDMPTNNVTPADAYQRLKDFLAELGIPAEPEQIGREEFGGELHPGTQTESPPE